MAIELSESNPYAYGQLSIFGDEMVLDRVRLDLSPTELDKWVTVRNEDRIDLISWRAYKNYVPNAHRWYWVICDANGIEDPTDLSDWVGKQIFIPDFFRVRLLLGIQ